jgi:hypothetical protein
MTKSAKDPNITDQTIIKVRTVEYIPKEVKFLMEEMKNNERRYSHFLLSTLYDFVGAHIEDKATSGKT